MRLGLWLGVLCSGLCVLLWVFARVSVLAFLGDFWQICEFARLSILQWRFVYGVGNILSSVWIICLVSCVLVELGGCVPCAVLL